jgi:hypothetical protein
MKGVRKSALVLAAVVLLALGPAACGGGNSDDSSVGTSAPTGADSTAGAANGGQADGSAGFRTPGGDNSIQSFGEEADGAEADAASAAVVAYMQARARDDWAQECAYLAAATVKPLEELAARSPQIEGKDCAAVLEALAGGAPGSTRANTMTGAVASLRFEGDRGFALYHGTRGVDYFVPMVKEDGEWKVGALAPSEFP